jgi:hypothetical protein
MFQTNCCVLLQDDPSVETSVSICRIPQRHIPEDNNLISSRSIPLPGTPQIDKHLEAGNSAVSNSIIWRNGFVAFTVKGFNSGEFKTGRLYEKAQ